MIKVGPKEYTKFLSKVWEKKIPLMVYGPPGIGKSQVPREFFETVVNDYNRRDNIPCKREYVEWSHLTKEQKVEAISNPEKYFILADLRISGMDATDLRGLPKLDGDFVSSTPYSWVNYFTEKHSMGCIFFDEINLAPPLIAAQAYEIILDRTIADRKLCDDVLVIGAGNRANDSAYTYPMPAPLKDRFAEIEMVPDSRAWTDWASKNGVNSYLISFIEWKGSYLYSMDKVKGEEKGSTPRGIVRASKMISGLDITDDFVIDLVSASCGEAFANEFAGYIAVFKSISWQDIFNNPAIVKNFKNDKAWAVCGGLVDQLRMNPSLFDPCMNVVDNLSKEFGAVAIVMLWNQCKDICQKYCMKSKAFATLAKKYSKILV